MNNTFLKKSIIYFIGGFLWSNYIHAQKMDETDEYKVGVKAGFTCSWYQTDRLNIIGDSVRYSPKPRQGFTVGMYSRQHMVRFLQLFNDRKEIKNWYWQFEACASFRGSNFNYYEGPKDSTGHFIYHTDGKVTDYKRSNNDRFRKISTFNIEVPLMLVWDIGNKQKNQILFGGDINYLISMEIFRYNDAFPLYNSSGSDLYNQYIDPKRWNSSLLLGYQYSFDKIGIQAMFRMGLQNVNKTIVVDINPQNNKPTVYIPGNLMPMSIDFSVIF